MSTPNEAGAPESGSQTAADNSSRQRQTRTARLSRGADRVRATVVDIEATTACYTSLSMGAAGSATKDAKPPEHAGFIRRATGNPHGSAPWT